MRHTDDVGRGDWIGPRLGDQSTILGVVPDGYDAYARIFHPIEVQWIKWRDRYPYSSSEETLTWAAAASRLGTTAHPLMQWGSLVRDRPPLRLDEDGWQWTEPQVGGLPVEQLAAASALLIRHTSTPKRCVAALWDGFGWMRPGGASIAISSSEELEPAEVDRLTAEAGRQSPSPLAPRVLAGPRLELPARAYFLFETDLTELGDPRWIRHERWGDSPNLLWPDDHAWCVASEIDLDSTLVGGSRALIDDLLATDGLEVAELAPDASLPTINRPHPHPPG